MHAFGANVLITRGISKGYGHFQTVLRGGSSLEEISKFAKSKKFNCKETPLFNFIPLDYVIINTLHLFIRMPHVIMDFHERILIMTGYETFLKNLGISFE